MVQSGRDAVAALFAGRHGEFVPAHESPWPDTLRRWVREGMPSDDDGRPVDAVDHFAFHMAGCGGWFDWHPRIGFEEVLEEAADWRVVRNGSGAVFRRWKDRSGVPEHIDFHMSDRSVWERHYRSLLTGDDVSRRVRNLKAQRATLSRRRQEGRWTFFGHQFIWENMRASMGDYNMFTALVNDPAWIHDYNRVYTDLTKSCMGLLFAEAGLPDGVWIYEDLGYRDRLFCSPATLAELIFPYYAEMVDFYHGYGLPVILHSCGYQGPAIPLAVEAGFDGLNPMEVKAGNDVMQYAEQYGDRLVFVGGLDARILESGDRDVIRAGVRAFIRGLRSRGARFVYASDHSLSTNVPYGDYLYSLQIYRECREN